MTKDERAPYHAYIGLLNEGVEGDPMDFGTTLEDVESWARGESRQPQGSNGEKQEQDLDAKAPDLHNQLDALTRRFADSMESFVPLVGVTGALRPVLAKNMIENQIRRPAVEAYSLVAEVGNAKIYGVPEEELGQLLRAISQVTEMQRGLGVLPGAALLSLVAVYDSYVAELVKLLLRERPDRYAHPDKRIAVHELLAMSSFDDVIDAVIEAEIDSMMRKSHQEQVEFIESNFNIKIRTEYKRWARYVEVFERRNLVAHGNIIVNKTYVKNCVAAGFKVDVAKLGTVLPLDNKYLKDAI